MKKYTFKVEGMMCGMCENHVTEAVQKTAKAKKIETSKDRGETVFTADNADVEAVKKAIEEEGYKVVDVKEEECESKGLFSFLKK